MLCAAVWSELIAIIMYFFSFSGIYQFTTLSRMDCGLDSQDLISWNKTPHSNRKVTKHHRGICFIRIFIQNILNQCHSLKQWKENLFISLVMKNCLDLNKCNWLVISVKMNRYKKLQLQKIIVKLICIDCDINLNFIVIKETLELHNFISL